MFQVLSFPVKSRISYCLTDMSILQENLPPTLTDSSPVANGIALSRNPLPFFARLAREAGDFAHYVLTDRIVYFVNDPQLVREVLIVHEESFSKWSSHDSFRLVFGTGLVGSQGELHRTIRKTAQQPLQSNRMPRFAQTIVELTERRQRSWGEGELDLSREMTLLTLEVIGQALFSISLGERAERIADATHALMQFNTKLSAADDLRAFEEANATITAVTHDVIDEAGAGPAHESLLSVLIAAQRAGVMSRDQLVQEIRTFLLAGHVTTAQTIACALWLLARRPGLQDRLGQEVDRVLGGRSPQAADVPQLAFCEMVFLETLRLYPPVWLFGRHALRDVQLDGHTIEAGKDLVICLWLLHRNAQFFPEPDTFNPDRWQNDARARLPRCVYLPFSTGARSCLGETFATMESILVLASIAQQWRFRELPGSPDPGWSAELLYWPRRGVRLRAEHRA